MTRRRSELIRTPGQSAAYALVREPKLIPLVILRGSGDSTRALAAEGAAHGVRTLAHADGGGVLYIHPSAERAVASALIGSSLDRLGVCNRLNLLLLDRRLWDSWLPEITGQLAGLGIRASLPPHDHPLGYEWALDSEREATVTIAPADGPAEAAMIANDETSGLAAGIAAADEARGGRVPRRLHRHRRLLERDDQAPRRLQAVRGAGDRNQPRRGPRSAGPGYLSRPLPPSACGNTCLSDFRCAEVAKVSILSMWWAMTSQRCLRLPRAGAKNMFAVLWRDANPALIRYLRVLAPDGAEDIAAETWVSVLRGLAAVHRR